MKRTVLVIIESIFFVWFFCPLLFKGIFNLGNLVGMCGMGLAIFFTLRQKKIEIWLDQCRVNKSFLLGEIFFRILLVLILLLLFVSAVRIAAAAYNRPPDNVAVLVLGCSVKGDQPSRVLKERLDTAYTYLSREKGTVCVLSGGKGEDEQISEAECMYKYLTNRGIAKDRLIMEENSTSTQENMQFSRAIFKERGLGNQVVIITSEFHEYRAGLLAREEGFIPYSYGASTNLLYFPTYFFREVLGVSYMWIQEKFFL